MSPRLLSIALVFSAALTGCASAPGIPETTYFRLPERSAIAPAAAPTLDAPLVVETFYADGVHSDQSLLYSTDPDGERLRAYHYQLWIDPPTRMLQRRLILSLDQARVAPLVVERLPPQQAQYRLEARIVALERIRRGEGWVVRAALQFRLDHSDGSAPLLIRDYARELAVSGNSVRDSVRSMGAAIDAIYLDLLGDLRALPARARG